MASSTELHEDYATNRKSLKTILTGGGVELDAALERYTRFADDPELAVKVWKDIRDPILVLLKGNNPHATKLVGTYAQVSGVASIIVADASVLGELTRLAGISLLSC